MSTISLQCIKDVQNEQGDVVDELFDLHSFTFAILVPRISPLIIPTVVYRPMFYFHSDLRCLLWIVAFPASKVFLRVM